MSSGSSLKCDACGSTDIDVDASRADAVCTNCGNVLESNIIVSDIQFEENAHGGASAIGTFVSSESKGGGSFGVRRSNCGGPGQFPATLGRESREITLKNARKKIEALAQQLSLRRDRIDMAFHFFKLALARHLTRGRKSAHVIAACVYITCRTEGTSHMLIDFSDVLQIDVYELGRTYLRLSQALCINIPVMDPCLYVIRFAHKLEFAKKTHEVSMTALRLVSRMKKDWIHFGRRPSGLCGAALLIAARLHDFNRTVGDIIKVVKVHESTLRKRLNEFGATPTSQLTLDEFMNVDLDAMTEEQDPPSFKAARKRDRERLLMLEREGNFGKVVSDLERKIERELEAMRTKQHQKNPYSKHLKAVSSMSSLDQEDSTDLEAMDADNFIAEETLGTINELLKHNASSTDQESLPSSRETSVLAIPGLGLKDTIQEYLVPSSADSQANGSCDQEEQEEPEELDLTGIDDDEIDGYLMSAQEIEYKTQMWMKINAEYLKEKAEKLEKERREREEAEREGREVKGKRQRKSGGENKRSKTGGAKNMGSGSNVNQTALEAIEKLVQEKKISTKINYDVLKSLSSPSAPQSSVATERPAEATSSIFGELPLKSPSSVNSPLPSNFKSFRLNRRNDHDLNLIEFGGKAPASKRAASEDTNVGPEKRSRTSTPPQPADNQSQDNDSSHVEVIVEHGAPPPSSAELDEEEAEDESEDEACLSAAQLLRKHRANEFDEVADYDDDYY